MKRVLTYGTFDLLHYGHIRLLQRAKALGDYLIVALSTDDFNELKGKRHIIIMKLEKNVRIYKICGFGNSRRMLGTKISDVKNMMLT